MLIHGGEDGCDLDLCFIQDEIRGSRSFVPLRPGLLAGNTKRFLSLPEKRFVGTSTQSHAKFNISVSVSAPLWRNLLLLLEGGTHHRLEDIFRHLHGEVEILLSWLGNESISVDGMIGVISS